MSKDDLSLILDVFADRLDFYAGWDEISASWVDAFEEIVDEDTGMVR